MNKEFKADDLYIGDIPADVAFLGDDMIFLRDAEERQIVFKTGAEESITYSINNKKKTVETAPNSTYSDYVLEKITTLDNFLNEEDNVKEIIQIPSLKDCESLEYFISDCQNITSLNFAGNNPDLCKNFYFTFNNLQNLTDLNLSGWNVNPRRYMEEQSGSYTNIYMIKSCTNLENFVPPTEIYGSFGVESEKLSVKSISDVVNALVPNKEVLMLILSKTVYETLTPEIIATATEKGYSIATYSYSDDGDLYDYKDKLKQ